MSYHYNASLRLVPLTSDVNRLPLYRSTDKRHDIALLKLVPNEAMKSRMLTHKAQPVELCDEDLDAAGLNCIVSGWGREQSGGKSLPDILRYVFDKYVLGTRILIRDNMQQKTPSDFFAGRLRLRW